MFPPTPAGRRQLGVTLKKMRIASCIGAREMGRLLGVSHTTILRFERGERTISDDMAERFNQAILTYGHEDDAA